MFIRTASTGVIRQAQDIWTGKARIPVRPQQHSIRKLEKLFLRWKDVKKLRGRTTPAEIKKRDDFKESG